MTTWKIYPLLKHLISQLRFLTVNSHIRSRNTCYSYAQLCPSTGFATAIYDLLRRPTALGPLGGRYYVNSPGHLSHTWPTWVEYLLQDPSYRWYTPRYSCIRHQSLHHIGNVARILIGTLEQP